MWFTTFQICYIQFTYLGNSLNPSQNKGVCIHTHTHTHTHTHVYIYIYMCVYIYMYVCVCMICIHTYIYINIIFKSFTHMIMRAGRSVICRANHRLETGRSRHFSLETELFFTLNLILLSGSLTDWMKPTHIIKDNLFSWRPKWL